MDTDIETIPRVYVGTYAKYNGGSIAGAWIDLDGMDKDSFLEKCAAPHSDEAEPEYMFQDFEGFPEAFYSEGGLADGLWDWLELDDDDRLILQLYADNCGWQHSDIDKAKEAYQGAWDNLEAWVENFWEDTGMLAEIPEQCRCYIDFAAWAKDCVLGGEIFTDEHDGQTHVFSNH